MGNSSKVLSEGDANELRTRVATLKEEQTKVALCLCEVLFKVYYGTVSTKDGDVKLWEAWRFESFDHFAESEVEIHHGRALAYVAVWDELYERRAIDPAVLPNSMTKLKQLARVSKKHRGNPKELLRWVSQAKKMTCCELQNAVDAEFGERGRRRNVSFYMKWARAKDLLKAVSTAKEEFGVSTNGEALTQIVDQWALLRKTAAARRLRAV